MRPGRHGGMSSGELEQIIARNSNFLTVRRAGGGDGYAALYNSVTFDFVAAIGGGWLPEFSRMTNLQRNCDCTIGGLCRTGMHGTNLVRGWRNMLYELLSRGRVHASKEIRRILGTNEAYSARDYGLMQAPMYDPSPAWEYSSIDTRSSA